MMFLAEVCEANNGQRQHGFSTGDVPSDALAHYVSSTR